MKKKLFSAFSFITTTCLLISFSSGVAFAAKPTPNSPAILTGNDISWPQCNKTLPQNQAFGIVGVNNGLANNTNSCLTTQLTWAAASKGGTGQPLVALYVNTANPGLAGSWWPTSNSYANTTIANPYGTCDGSDTAACAYIYGYAKAYDDATVRGVNNPGTYTWWLDVETGNSWETNTVANAADLEGMTTYFKSIGAHVGLYSTSYQWNKIAGTVSATSPLNGLQSWIPGARSSSSAKANCSLAPLTSGSPVTVTQYVSNTLDYDVSCI